MDLEQVFEVLWKLEAEGLKNVEFRGLSSGLPGLVVFFDYH